MDKAACNTVDMPDIAANRAHRNTVVVAGNHHPDRTYGLPNLGDRQTGKRVSRVAHSNALNIKPCPGEAKF